MLVPIHLLLDIMVSDTVLDNQYTISYNSEHCFSQCVAITEPIYNGQDARDYLQSKVNPVLLKALTHLSKQKPEDPLVSTHIVNMFTPGKSPNNGTKVGTI